VNQASHNAPLNALRAENAQLRQALDQARQQNDQARRTLERLEERLAQVEHHYAELKRLVYGAKRERFVPDAWPDQLPLFDGLAMVEAVEPPEPSASEPTTRPPQANPRVRSKPRRQALPAHLPRQEEVLEPDVDTTGLRCIGQEVTETLDYVPAKLVVRRRIRPKYVDPQDPDRGVIIADLPARPIDKGLPEPGLLAQVAIEKYVDHLPLYRQVQRFARSGITLARSTLGDWIAATADLLAPLYEAVCREALASGYLQADETPIAVQDSQKASTTHRGYYWVYHAVESGLVVLVYQPGRGAEGPKAMLAAYQGALQSDGYAVYDDYDTRPEIVSYNCWAHARRKFFEAQSNAPDRSAHALTEIARLYEIERVLRERDASPAERQALRQAEAVPILARFKSWLEANPGLPKSPWGQAVAYSLNRWAKLNRYCDDGRIEIDNNLIENAIRPIALGRRNYLFAGSHEAAQRAAVIYSLLGTCKKHEVHVYDWLKDVLERIPTHPHKRVKELLPHHWKKERESGQ
jgi:transposase